MRSLSVKRAFLVVGPESSGTRLVTRILIDAGAIGDATHAQRFDQTGLLASTLPDLIVWRRSLPHSGCWIDAANWIESVRLLGYQVDVLFVTRDWHATISSQLAAGHVQNRDEAEENLRRAYSLLATISAPFRVVSYEALRDRGCLQALLRDLLLSVDVCVEVADENAKWYEDVVD